MNGSDFRVPIVEEICNRMAAQVFELKTRIALLLREHGVTARCLKCSEELFILRSASGRGNHLVAYDVEGRRHEIGACAEEGDEENAG